MARPYSRLSPPCVTVSTLKRPTSHGAARESFRDCTRARARPASPAGSTGARAAHDGSGGRLEAGPSKRHRPCLPQRPRTPSSLGSRSPADAPLLKASGRRAGSGFRTTTVRPLFRTVARVPGESWSQAACHRPATGSARPQTPLPPRVDNTAVLAHPGLSMALHVRQLRPAGLAGVALPATAAGPGPSHTEGVRRFTQNNMWCGARPLAYGRCAHAYPVSVVRRL